MHFGLGPDIDAARGLVDDQYAGTASNPFGDNNLLLVAAAEIKSFLFDRGRLDAEAPYKAFAPIRFLTSIDEIQSAVFGQMRQAEILPHRHTKDKPLTFAILSHKPDAVRNRCRGISDICALAVDSDFPVIRPQPEDHFHDFSAPSADQAKKTEHLSLAQIEADVSHIGLMNCGMLHRKPTNRKQNLVGRV